MNLFSGLTPNCKILMSQYKLFLLANTTFASSIYAYNSSSTWASYLYVPGLYLSFLLYKTLGTIANNEIRLLPKTEAVWKSAPLVAFMALNLLFPFQIQKFWGKDFHEKSY